MLSSGFMNSSTALALSNFRESHGGTLSGMTRFTTHLDDMPAIGYAMSDVALDRVNRFNLLLFGHMANYQSRGTFHSTEQLSLVGSAPKNFRDYYTLAEYDISFCVPSALLVAHMLKYALVAEARDTQTIWLMKMAPRRWFATESSTASLPAVDVKNALTRAGSLSFQIFAAQPKQLRVVVALVGAGAAVQARSSNESGGGTLLKIRLRDAGSAALKLDSVQDKEGRDCGGEWSVDPTAQTVDIQLGTVGSAGPNLRCNFTAVFK